MKSGARLIALLLLVSCGSLPAFADNPPPQPAAQKPVNPLKWLDTADLDQMFNADIKAGVTEFYVYCGFGCFVPSTQSSTALICYPTARYRNMVGGSDAIVDDEDDRLQRKAVKFAESYNDKLAQYLTNRGLSKCRAGERWDGVVKDLDESFSGFDMSGNPKEWADPAYDKKTNRFRFAVYLLPDHRNEAAYKHICSVLDGHKLSGKVIVELYDAPTHNPLSSIACEDGAVEPSDYPALPGFDDGADTGGAN